MNGVFEVRVPLIDNTEVSLIPDYAIESAEDICKNFFLTDNGADYAVVNPNIEAGTTCDPTR